jgi:SAM-dependent methyltransferase
MGQWFETFFAGLYGRVLAAQFDTPRTRRQARLVKRLLGLRRGRRVLDCPCGQGRLTLPLARMGLTMTGVDLTASYLRRARAEARRRGLKIHFMRSDMRRIDFNGEFDAAINWFSSFGYFSDAGNLAFCRRIRRALRPGGQFLIEVLNKTWLIRRLRAGHDETINGVRIVNRSRWDARSSRIRDTWVMSRRGRVERRRIVMRVYSGPEMRALLRSAGFRDIRLLTHTGGDVARLTRHSHRLIAIARRP